MRTEHRTRRVLRRIALYVSLTVMALPFVVPTLWMVASSFKPLNEIFASPPSLFSASPTTAAYAEAFDFQPFARQYFNSVYIALVVTATVLLVSALAGYAFARIRFPGRNPLFITVLVGLLVPSEVTIVPLFQMFKLAGMVDTHWPLILVTAFAAPCVLATFVMRQFFIALPVELEEAARLDGLGRFGTWWRIAVPLAKPALSAVAILTFLASWNLYLEPTVYLTSPELFTLPQALTRFTDAYGGEMWNTQLAAATMTVVPVVVVFLVAQRQFVESLAHTGLKG
ncbi:carbohydrate ABC transporter permease [Phytomonospora endophytica]|uniref:Multiple sugar transport system permease protein n=1 Tax=Phytomonospora endophytica TaxID=714109 RepID=A0A841FSW9_9ACTN|nr:carbohydrate ABC transporter permease [Phytomonospora endophytica]MBB6037903.1 multiple sugar transport system permease protein [Phytomonospora endophytica]GIG68803.1 sn-glycerol-3-phosphate transport system permease protein UgpE [Phytomonospora endophytica]